jgi:hypothetical protein
MMRIVTLAGECFFAYFVLGFLASAAWLLGSIYRQWRADMRYRQESNLAVPPERAYPAQRADQARQAQ